MVEYLPSILEVLGSISNTADRKHTGAGLISQHQGGGGRKITGSSLATFAVSLRTAWATCLKNQTNTKPLLWPISIVPAVRKSKQDRALQRPALGRLTGSQRGTSEACDGQDPEGQPERTSSSPHMTGSPLAGFPRLYKVLIKYCKMLVRNRWLPSAVLKLNIWKEHKFASLL